MLTVLGIVFVLFVELFFPLILPAIVVFLLFRLALKWARNNPQDSFWWE